MLCKRPFVKGGTVPFGCGQCLPCRLNRRRVWTARQVLESFMHDESVFVTLTYDEEHVHPDGHLVPDHVTRWLKRFRKAIYPLKVRYFLCGEYGDTSWRPHYHLSLFGVGRWCEELIEETWPYGFVQVGDFNEQTAQYVAGYVVKKLTNEDHHALDGRPPEYARQSRRPGLDADAYGCSS